MSISIRVLGKTLAVGAVSALLLIVPALAQDAKGEFTLSKEVRWGAATLKPGTYGYSLEHHASEVLIVRAAEGGAGYLMMARSVGRARPAETDSLQLSRHGSEWVVSSLIVHNLDEELFFSMPEPLAPEARGTHVVDCKAVGTGLVGSDGSCSPAFWQHLAHPRNCAEHPNE